MSLSHSTAALAAFLCLFAFVNTAPIDEVAPQPLADPPNYRLPTIIKPSEYNITLKPLLLENDGDKRFTFEGEVYIIVTTTEATKTLVLHSKNLNYTTEEYWATKDTNPTVKKLTNAVIDDVTDKRTYTLVDNLALQTNYTLHFKFVGSMDDDMHGFYRSSYTDKNNVTKWLGSTQFQTNHARRAFPSFDEPSFKAVFNVSIIRHKSMNTFSNTRILQIERMGDFYKDIYTPTPKMSTYLLAFLVSEFNERFNGDFGVIARQEYYAQTEYSFTVGQLILKEFDNYLGLPYYDQGNDKMHMAAIPDFSAGAMENWGLLTYRERGLLYQEGSTNLNSKQYIAAVVAHEQAHMWFGDLVTCDWWSYTWLNEGFARYFQYHMTAKVETGLALEQQFVVDQIQVVMGMDSTNNTNPMSDPNTNSPSDLSRMFNSISYNKGGSVIRMIRNVMGEDKFKQSLNEYLTKHKYQNTVPQNLLDIWTKYWPSDDKEQAPLVFKSFTEQVGYPVVTVKVADDGMALTIKQNRFLLNSTDGSNTELFYTVPFTYTTNVDKDFNATTTKLYLPASNAEITVPLDKKADWVIANIQESGYYRVNYDTKHWHSIHHELFTSNWGGIHELNRAQIVDDLFQLARANVIDYDLALNITEYLDTEVNYLPWTAAFNSYNFLTIRLGTDTKHFGIHILQQLEKAYNLVGFEEKITDSALTIYNRAKVLAWACKYGNEHCIREAKQRFDVMLSSPVPVNIRSVVYCSAMREGTENDFNTLFNKYKGETVATEQVLILNALGCVKNENLVKKYFDIIIGNDVRRQDKSAALTSLYSENNENVTPVFDLVTAKYVELAESMGSFSAVAGVISNIASRFTDESQAKKLQDFNKAHSDKFGASSATLLAAEKTVAINLKWSSDRLGTFKQYLERRAAKGSAGAIGSFTVLTVLLMAAISMLLR